MKIMMISATDLPIPAYKGGATETLMTELLSTDLILKNNDIEIDVFCHCAGENFSNGNVNYCYIAPNIFDRVYFTFYRIRRLIMLRKVNIPDYFPIRLNKKVDLNKYDVIILEGNKNQVLNLRKNYKGIIVLHIHTVITFTPNTPDVIRIFDNCDYIIANSNYSQKTMKKIKETDGSKVLLLPNCVNSDLFNISNGQNIRKKLGIGNEEFVYLYCGRLEIGKGVLELIRAYKKCLHDGILVIVGASWFSSNKKTKYVKELEKESLEIKDRVFFTGYINHVKLSDYYKMANVVIMPSIYNEAAGLVAIEAQMCGVPVIVSKVGGLPEFVHEKSELKIEVDDKFIENLGAKMVELKLNKELYDREKSLALENVKKYTMKQYATNFLEIVNQYFRK